MGKRAFGEEGFRAETARRGRALSDLGGTDGEDALLPEAHTDTPGGRGRRAGPQGGSA